MLIVYIPPILSFKGVVNNCGLKGGVKCSMMVNIFTPHPKKCGKSQRAYLNCMVMTCIFEIE